MTMGTYFVLSGGKRVGKLTAMGKQEGEKARLKFTWAVHPSDLLRRFMFDGERISFDDTPGEVEFRSATAFLVWIHDNVAEQDYSLIGGEFS